MKKDETTCNQIVGLIASGVSHKNAAQACGIAKSTLMRWKKEDQDFRDRIRKAEGIAHAKAVKAISDQWTKSWQSAAWWLERRYPEQYARPSTEARGEILSPQEQEKNRPDKPPFSALMKDYDEVVSLMRKRGVAPWLIQMIETFLNHPFFEIYSDGLDVQELLKLVSENEHRFRESLPEDYRRFDQQERFVQLLNNLADSGDSHPPSLAGIGSIQPASNIRNNEE